MTKLVSKHLEGNSIKNSTQPSNKHNIGLGEYISGRFKNSKFSVNRFKEPYSIEDKNFKSKLIPKNKSTRPTSGLITTNTPTNNK